MDSFFVVAISVMGILTIAILFLSVVHFINEIKRVLRWRR
jgi:hypothetical protein